MMLKTYMRDAVMAAAKKRKPGYLDAVMAAVVASTPDTITLTAEDAARITNDYGDGKPIVRRANVGGCGPCGGGKGKQSTQADAAWHSAVNQTEGMQ